MWKLFYHDRTAFSSNDGEWSEAPAWGTMGLAYVDETVGYSRDSGDFYILAPWGDGEPWACDHWGLMDYLLQIGKIQTDQSVLELSADELVAAGVKFGRSIRSDEWAEVCRWMDNDPELPRKSARYRHERP